MGSAFLSLEEKLFRLAMSPSSFGSQLGLCTLTATFRPSSSVAACTCAMEAAPSGSSSKLAKIEDRSSPKHYGQTLMSDSTLTGYHNDVLLQRRPMNEG